MGYIETLEHDEKEYMVSLGDQSNPLNWPEITEELYGFMDEEAEDGGFIIMAPRKDHTNER